MKTRIEWLNDLPDGYRERAVANCKEWTDGKPTDVYLSIQEAIQGMCNWFETPEKEEFWRDVYFHYAYGTPLPPLPYTASTLPTLEEIKEVLWQCAKTEVSEGGATITRMFDKEASAILELIKSKQ